MVIPAPSPSEVYLQNGRTQHSFHSYFLMQSEQMLGEMYYTRCIQEFHVRDGIVGARNCLTETCPMPNN